MATKGIDFIIKVGANTVACQRGGTLNRDSETIDISCKDDTWRSFVTNMKTWSISGDGLYILSDTGLEALETAFNSGASVTVQFVDVNATGTTSGTGDLEGWEGTAYITSFPVDAPYEDALMYTIELQGSGALEEIRVVA